ncbi:MAG: hypothetical protein A2Y73_00030 [Chloroflexi bacterium RBG_13_56_8]|nr:MAG: hypothetical protein A2Y73_00030 [Chloroflexi bacterium RBG_13_56_8]
MIRILLVDDQAIVREGLKSMLGLEPDMAIVGEAGDGEQAIQLVRKSAPDIVLMDVRMPGMDGLAALERLKLLAPKTSVIMVTLYEDPDYLLRAVSSGAAGYVLKDTSREDLVRAIRVATEGGAIIAPNMMPQLLRRLREMTIATPQLDANTPEADLSQRELQVLRLITEGHTNSEIAEKLFLSPTTIKTHVQNILRKLDVSDRTQAAVYAVRHGLA